MTITSENIFKRALLDQLADLLLHCTDKRQTWLKDQIGKIATMADSQIDKAVFVSVLKQFISLPVK